MRCTFSRLANTATSGGADFTVRLTDFCTFMKGSRASLDGVAVRPREGDCRGLYATSIFGEGTTVLSVPLHNLGISADRLLQSSAQLQSLKPPSLDEVRHLMSARSIQDTVLYEQVYLALLLAAEHMQANSTLNTYLNILPHPAINDAAVIAANKRSVDPMALLEWDGYQKELLAVLHIVLRRWGPRAPPVEVAYWALRTVLSRMHMLPVHGVAPEDVGSSLNYTALSTVDRADRQRKWRRRVRAVWGALRGQLSAGEDYRLVPTLVPLLDMAGHLPSGNVRVEVTTRSGIGSCVELRALRKIQSGEEIGLRFNSSQSPAFLLFRFGFIPH